MQSEKVNTVFGLTGTWGRWEMSCRDTIHLICMYLEGKLSEPVQTEIEHHLTSCADCRLVLEAATSTLDRYFSTTKVATNSQAA